MAIEYRLGDFFSEYMFRGGIQLPTPESESEFELDFHKYDSNGQFTASALDSRGRSSVVGCIYPVDSNSSHLTFTQTFHPKATFNFDAELVKTENDLLLQGVYTHPNDIKEYSFELGAIPKQSRCGWKNILEETVLPNLVLPRNE